MALWIRGSTTATLGALGVYDSQEETQFHNQTGNPFTDLDIVIVDGFLTLITNTDALCGFRFVRGPEAQVAGDYNEGLPEEGAPDIWYSMFHARGPVMYCLRSKFTIYPQYKLWTTAWKEQEATSTLLSAGWRLLVVKK